MSEFARFPPTPLAGEVTVAEQNCSLVSEAAVSRIDGGVGQWDNSSYTAPGRQNNLVKRT